jgi:hypothetical protein
VLFHVQGLGYRDSQCVAPLDYAKVKSCDEDDAAPLHPTTSSGYLVHVGVQSFSMIVTGATLKKRIG